MTEEILTTDEATAYLKISKRTLFRLIKNGKVRALKIGSIYRFKKHELDEDLKINTKERMVATK